MNKIYLTVALLCPVLMASSQNAERMSIQNQTQKQDFSKQIISDRSTEEVLYSPSTVSYGNIIGQTSYDLQSNYGNGGTRIQQFSDGRISAVWMQSLTLFGGHPDRGTGYNSFDPISLSWDTGETNWYGLNTVRTGWPQLLDMGNSEMTIQHDFTVSNIVINSRDTIGYGSWGVSQGFTLDAVWPRAANVGDTIHMIAIDNQNASHNGIVDPLKYYRSDDGGQSWSVTGYVNFPDYNNSTFWFSEIPGDAYAIDAYENYVAFVVGGGWDPLVLYKSDNYGEDGSWTKTVIYKPDTSYSLRDNLNQRYVVQSLSSELSLIIDKNGQVNVSTTGMALSWYFGEDKPQNQNGLQFYNPLISMGIYYWNEGMGTIAQVYNEFVTTANPGGNALYPIAYFYDYTGEGDYDIPDNVNDIGTYGSGLAGHSNIALDQDSGIFMVWSQVAETSEQLLPDNYRDLYMVYSFDKGQSWSGPVNIAALEVLDDGFSGGTLAEEEVFPSTIKRIGNDDKLHMVFQTDAQAGMHVAGDMHPIAFAEMVYYPIDISYFRNLSSTEEQKFTKADLKLYPNPARNYLALESSEEPESVKIFNLVGRQMKNVEIRKTSDLILEIDISSLEKGIYLLNLESTGKLITKKFVKE